MKCKNCTKGLVLEKKEIMPDQQKELDALDLGPTIALDAVACDCCGGYFESCENCAAGKPVIKWID